LFVVDIWISVRLLREAEYNLRGCQRQQVNCFTLLRVSDDYCEPRGQERSDGADRRLRRPAGTGDCCDRQGDRCFRNSADGVAQELGSFLPDAACGGIDNDADGTW
jgi:hypothetical protein